MDYFKITANELRSKDKAELTTVTKEVQKKLAETRMDIYTAPSVNVTNVKKLRKALARVLTVQNEKARAKA